MTAGVRYAVAERGFRPLRSLYQPTPGLTH